MTTKNMTKTNFKKVIENEGEGLKIIKVEEKDVIDKDTGKPIKYKTVKFTYEHPQDNGTKIRAAPAFTTPALTFPRGIDFNMRKRLSAMVLFNKEDEETKLFISNKTRTQQRGWVPSENVKITTKDGKTYAKAKREGELYSDYNADNKQVIGTFVKDDIMPVEDELDLDDENTWYLVAHGGTEGFFSTMANKIAELIKNHKGCGHSDKSFDQIRNMIYKGSDGIYWPIDKETGKLIEGKNPSLFFTCSYFPPKEGKKENYVKFLVPGQKEALPLEVMKKCSLKVKSAVVKLIDVFVSSDKIVPHIYLTEALVTDIDEIKYSDQLEAESEELAQDEELVNKLAKQLKASKKFETVEKQEQNVVNEVDGEDGDDFNTLIKNEPVRQNNSILVEPTLEEDIEIPGIPE